MAQSQKTTWWPAVATAVMAMVQWILVCWKPIEPLVWLPAIAAVVFALVMWFHSANWLRRWAAALFTSGVGIGALPSLGVRIRWAGNGLVEVVPLEGSTAVSLVCIATGAFLVTLQYCEGKFLKAAALAFPVMLVLAIGGMSIGAATSGSNVRAKSGRRQTTTAGDINLQNAPGAVVNSNVGGDVHIWPPAAPARAVQMDPADLDRPTYREIASMLTDLQSQMSWDSAELREEMTRPAAISSEDVSLSVQNLTGSSLRVTLIDCSICFDEQGQSKTVSSPVEDSFIRGAEACPTLLSFKVDPMLEGMKHSALISDFAQFCNPSGWFVVFSDYLDPQGDRIRVPLGVFNLYDETEPVLQLKTQEDDGDGRTVRAQLLK